MTDSTTDTASDTASCSEESNIMEENTTKDEDNTQKEDGKGEEEPQPPKEFVVGDHVFCWCSYRGIPFAYQQHGIVIEVNGDDLKDGSIVIMNLDYEEPEETEREDDATPKLDDTSCSATSNQDYVTLVHKAGKDEEKKDEPKEECPKKNEPAAFASFWKKDTTENTASSAGSDQSTAQQTQQENPLQRSIANWFQRSNTSQTPVVDQEEKAGDINPEKSQQDSKPETSDMPQEKENQFTKGIANFFQKRNNNSNTNSNDTKDDEETTATKEQQFQRSESSLSTLFASVPDDRPCTMTRQTISIQEAHEKWEHVLYGQQWHRRLVSRAGTCSPLQQHPRTVVLMRLHFLRQHPELLAAVPYHHQKSNGECIAVWCQAGQYTSFSGTAKMGKPGLHAATFGMAAEYGAIWGGQIAAAILFPPATPFLLAYDIYDLYHYGHAAHAVHHANKEWEERTIVWNQAFSEYLQEHHDTLIEVVEETLASSDKDNVDNNTTTTTTTTTTGEAQQIKVVEASVSAAEDETAAAAAAAAAKVEEGPALVNVRVAPVEVEV